jgi:PucR family transcriptional regulator, purine catabolism regulatory protein
VGAESVPLRALNGGAGSAGKLRSVHQEMVDAALTYAGVERLAELAAAHVARPVAIVVPERGVAAEWMVESPGHALEALQSYETERAAGRSAEVPAGVELLVPIKLGGTVVGSVAMLHGPAPPRVDAAEVLHLAALVTVTSLALEEARAQQSSAQIAQGLIDELRRGDVGPQELARRAGRLGRDLSRGAVVLVTQMRSSRPREAMSVVSREYPEAIAELIDGRVYAVLPARRGEDGPESAVKAATALVGRLRSYGRTGFSSFYQEPADLRRAIQEAEFVLEVISRDERMAEELGSGTSSGVYRLLFRALASDPAEVRSFYEDTVAPVIRYDDQYHTDLLSTLESYLANDCNMNATAREIYAHRHTVAYRLQRVRELSGLDPMISEDRERLSLGLKAYRIVAPTLPR